MCLDSVFVIFDNEGFCYLIKESGLSRNFRDLSAREKDSELRQNAGMIYENRGCTWILTEFLAEGLFSRCLRWHGTNHGISRFV